MHATVDLAEYQRLQGVERELAALRQERDRIALDLADRLAWEAADALAAAWIYRGQGGSHKGTADQLEVYVEIHETIAALSPEAALLLGTYLASAMNPCQLRRLRSNLVRRASEGRT